MWRGRESRKAEIAMEELREDAYGKSERGMHGGNKKKLR